jgi:hypothetical protein
LKPQTSTLFKFRAGGGNTSGVSGLSGAAPTINIINTLAQKIGPIDEIKETEAKGEVSVRKITKAKKSGDNNTLQANLSNGNYQNYLSPHDDNNLSWNYVPSKRKISLRESPSRRINRHL